jgi:glycosyltransferase involved in cell wall biosynthesis
MNGAAPLHTSPAGSPIVSVFMPVYNGEPFITQAIESLLGQTFRPFELIVVDDGSTDGTAEIARQYVERDPRVRLLRHETNRGLSAARNSGWKAASPGSLFIMNHDSDDISLPTALENLVTYLDNHEEIAAVGSFCDYIDQEGAVIGWAPTEWHPVCIRATFGRLNSVAISATLVRRRLYEKIAPFRPEFGSCDDYNFWSRSLQAGYRIANIPKVLHLIRLHPKSLTATGVADMSRVSGLIGREYREAMRESALESIIAAALVATLRVRVRAARALYAKRRRVTR